jgi:uncharacterized membrane protein YbhN (UPF0104 family)
LPFLVTAIISVSGFGRRLTLPQQRGRALITALLPALCLYEIFLLVAGFLLVATVWYVSGITGESQTLAIVGTFAVSWVAGLLTPGAPAGVGIREAVMILALKTLVGEPEAVATALLFRLITTIGDVLFFLTSYAFARGVASGLR